MVEINDESQGAYDKDNQIKFKNSTIRSNLCDYTMPTYLLVELSQLPEMEIMMPRKIRWKKWSSTIWKLCAIYWVYKWYK